MKVIDVHGKLNEEIILKEIEEQLGLIEDIHFINNDKNTDYQQYRIFKAAEKIRMYLNKVELKLKKKK